MTIRNVVLTGNQEKFVAHLIASGRFRNAAEVLRAGIVLLEKSDKTNARNRNSNSSETRQLILDWITSNNEID